MKIEHLSQILEIARIGSITGAAKKLWISPTTLSSMLKNIEDELGVTIFTRQRKGLVPTVQGELVLRQAEDILASYERMKSIGNKDNELGKIVTLSCYHSMVPILAPKLASMLQREDQTMLRIRSELPEDMLTTMGKGLADIGVTLIHPNDLDILIRFLASTRLTVEVLCRDRFVVCFGANGLPEKDRPITMKYLKTRKLCIASYFPKLTASFPSIEFGDFVIHSVSDEFSSLKETVASTDAVSFISEFIIRNDIYVKTGQLYVRPVSDADLRLLHLLIYPSDAKEQARLNKIISAIRERYSELAPSV